MDEQETSEQMQARHRKELKELQGRITNKKKNATKKSRKGVNDECAEMETRLREKQSQETASLTRDNDSDDDDTEESQSPNRPLGKGDGSVEEMTSRLQLSTVSSSPSGGANGKNASSNIEAPATPSPASTAAAAGGGGGGGGGGGDKKRNRQKERLARRAAEQEAAIQKAEDEASSMTDHRARESTYMKKIFETHHLTEQEIAPDGHCLFSAVADQLGQHGIPLDRPPGAADGSEAEARYKITRRVAVEYMLSHRDDFAPFLEEDLDGYAHKVKNTAEWGGQLELMALARNYGVEIRVVQDGRMEKIGKTEDGQSEDDDGKVLWLAYYRHGYGLGEHYNSLRKGAK